MFKFSGQPNNLSPVQLLLQNMERQQIQRSIDAQYAKLRGEMTNEAIGSLKELQEKKKEVKPKTVDSSLQGLLKQGVAKVKPAIEVKEGDKLVEGSELLKGQLSAEQYMKLNMDQQLKYDREMATQYQKKGLGPYHPPRLIRNKKNYEKTKYVPHIVDFGPKDKRQVL